MSRSHNRAVAWARFILWLLTILAALIGIPVVLIVVRGAPWSWHWSHVGRGLSELAHQVNATNTVTIMVGVGWLAWLWIAIESIRECVSMTSHRKRHLVPGGAMVRQAIAAAREVQLGRGRAMMYTALLGFPPMPPALLAERRLLTRSVRQEEITPPKRARILDQHRLPSWVRNDAASLWWLDATLRVLSRDPALAELPRPFPRLVSVNQDGVDAWYFNVIEEPPGSPFDLLDEHIGWLTANRAGRTGRTLASSLVSEPLTSTLYPIPLWTNDVGALTSVCLAPGEVMAVRRTDADAIARAIVQASSVAPWIDELCIVVIGEELALCDADVVLERPEELRDNIRSETGVLVVTTSPLDRSWLSNESGPLPSVVTTAWDAVDVDVLLDGDGFLLADDRRWQVMPPEQTVAA